MKHFEIDFNGIYHLFTIANSANGPLNEHLCFKITYTWFY